MEPYDLVVNQPVVIDNVSNYYINNTYTQIKCLVTLLW